MASKRIQSVSKEHALAHVSKEWTQTIITHLIFSHFSQHITIPLTPWRSYSNNNNKTSTKKNIYIKLWNIHFPFSICLCNAHVDTNTNSLPIEVKFGWSWRQAYWVGKWPTFSLSSSLFLSHHHQTKRKKIINL